MPKYPQAPPLPGAGTPRNLVPAKDGCEACPCCGALWKGGRPWSEVVLTPAQVSEKTGLSQQAITTRIRQGSIAAYYAAGAAGRNKYLIPVFEFQRVLELDESKGGIRPESRIKDLGVNRG